MLRVFLLFFFSGCAALVYELLWFRQLGFIFGNTVHAATAVLTAYMLGLALGARLMANRAPRLLQPVKVFAALEFGIGLYALLVPSLFAAVRIAYRAAFQHLTEHTATLAALRFVLAMLVLLAPTMLMGATLPVLAQALVRNDGRFGRRLSALYGLNTFGAMVGVAAGGFLLMPGLGITRSTWLAAAINALVALFAMQTGRGWKAPPVPGGLDAAPSPPVSVPSLALALAALSGFVALAMEVVWFRALTLVFGSTTYSFTAMLAVFLFGLGLGSAALGWLADRARQPAGLYALLQVGIGLASLAAMYAYPNQPEFLLNGLIARGFDWRVMVGLQVVITLKCLLVPTLLMGLSFPLLVTWFRRAFGDSARAVGRIYAANTIGCVLGSLAGGFLLLPTLGIRTSLVLLAAASLAAGLFALLARGTTLPWRAAVSGVALMTGLWLGFAPPAWDPKLLSAGPHFSPWQYVQDGRSTLAQKLNDQDLLFYHEGITATVSVSQTLDQNIAYCSGGKTEADSSPRSMMLQRIAGHLPMLFHAGPKRVLNIGLGAGVSFGALGCHDVEHLEVVEIEPAAVEVAQIFGPFNHQVVNRPGARITIADGRNFLFCTTNLFDVITSDPFEPVHAGANHLYTREHFAQARSRLRPGGIMSQYVPLYELDTADYLAIVRAFVGVFPNTLLFYTGEDTILLGFRDEVALDPARIRARFAQPRVSASLGELGLTQPETILGMFVADLRHAPGLTAPGAINTDDRPIVEYSAPKSALRYTTFGTCRALLDNFTPLPEFLLAGLDEAQRRKAEEEHEGLRLALAANLEREAGRTEKSFELLTQAVRTAPGNPVIRSELISLLLPSADGLRSQGDLGAALQQYLAVLQLRDREFWALFNAVNLAMPLGQQQLAADCLQRSSAWYPRSGLVRAQLGKFLATQGRCDEALNQVREAARLAPRQAPVWDDYASVARACKASDESLRASAIAMRLRAASAPPAAP